MTRKAFMAGSACRIFSGFGPQIMFAPEGEGAGGAGPGGDAGAGAADAGAGAAGAAGGEGKNGAAGAGAAAGNGDAGGAGGDAVGAKGAGYRPEGLPDHLYGADDKDTLDKVNAALKGYRDDQAKREAPPKDAAGYKFELPDTAKPFFDGDKDPAFDVIKGVAHKHGLTDSALTGFLGDLLPSLEAKGIISAYDPKKELSLVFAGLGEKETPEGKANVSKYMEDVDAWAEGLSKQLGLPEDQAAVLGALTDTGPGNLLLGKLKDVFSEHGIQVETTSRSTGSGLSKDDLSKLDSDPRIDPSSPKYDKDLRAQYDAAYKRNHPG